MKPITFSSLFVFILFAFPKISLGQINGLSDICIQECAVYEYSTGLGGPYFWQSTGNFKQGNTGEEVEVCWDVIGSNTLTVIDLSAPISSQTATVNIQVAPIPEVEIIFPLYPNCVISDSLDNGTEQEQVLECFTACPSSIGSYRAFNWQGNSLTWVVDGGTIINESNDEVEILWDASGSGFISLSEENTTGCFDSISYCIEILVPVDSDILVFGGGANQIEICKGSTVYFQAISDEGSSFIWDLGNGSVASGINVDETYNAPGNYTVSLISQSSCSCFDTSYYQVIVEDAVSPEIDCVGTVCSSDEQTYTASEVCTSYTWSVSGEGTIVGGGGVGDDFVTVSWNTGPVGTISLSTSGCATSTCDEPVLVQIPIIDGSAQIIGPSEICKSRNARFYIQDYDGTEYYWGIVGNGSIVSGHGTSEIEVQWEDAPWADDTAIIQVEYNNCYLECSGSATLDIELKDEFDVSTNPITCENNSAFLSGVVGWNSANLDWDIVSPSGVLTTYTNESFLNLSGLELGEYNVTAIDAADMYCNSEIQFTFQVVPEPDISSFPLNGPTEICVGEYYNYSLDIYDSKYFMRWTVDDGGSTNFYTSNPIAVQWTSTGPYKLSYRITDQETNCNSETMEVDLFPISSTAISGNNRTCLDAIETYVFTTPSSSNVVWEVIPPTAGSIKQNADNSIDIQWHETGNHQLTTNYCGANLIYNVEVLDLPSAEPVYDSPVCPGELSSVNVPISSGESVEIIDENNALVSSVANSMLPPGIFTVQVFSEEYCIKNYPIVIDSFPISTVRISSPDGNAFCPPHPGVLITALDTKEGYTYEWYRDNVAIGETTDAIMTNIFGTYHVVVTDINGCEIMSNEHTLYEFCGTGSPSDPAPGTGPITFDESYLQCNDLEFTITSSTHSSTSFTWYFDYPNSDPDFISYEENPTFYYPEAGYYYVVVFGNIFPEYGAKVITVPAVSRFKYDVACVGENTQFTDISTFIPAYPITGYEWNFGDVASGSDNTSTLQNPEHNYTVPGFYLVTLTVTSTFGCTSYYEELIEVKEGPDSGIIMPFSSCADRGLEFRALSGSDNFIYAWDFGDPSSGAGNESASQNTIHTFSGNGVYEVTLEVTNVYGCTETYREDITIVSSQLTGDITSSTSFPICRGESAVLTAPSGGIDYYWSNGEIGTTITVEDPGVYSVTITEAGGCYYVPAPINVIVEGNVNSRITGYEVLPNFVSISYFDSMSICKGEEVAFSTVYLQNASYDWSIGGASSYIFGFDNLPVGRNEVTVDITDPETNCIITSDPFIVNVYDKPEKPIIDNQDALCEGTSHDLSVSNPEAGVQYYWSNGARGLSTTVSQRGYYTVTAVNTFGCERESSGVSVLALPDANINTGCVDACFPDTLCHPSSLGTSMYHWLLDGSLVASSSFNQDFIIDGPGAYQLVVENFYGCTDTSEVLNISALPSDQSLSGIVYIDENGNGVFDAGDILLDNVPVNLMEGSVISETVISDANGYYIFDPVTVMNPMVSIDTTGLGLDIQGSLSFAVQFDNCIDDEEQDFPLTTECVSIEEEIEMGICPNDFITIDGNPYFGGDVAIITELSAEGCDSTTMISIVEFPTMGVEFIVDNTCPGTNEGTLEIIHVLGDNYTFAIDGGTFVPDSLHEGISPGNHTVYIQDENGCQLLYPFDIEIFQEPAVSHATMGSCPNDINGELTIINTSGVNLEYSMDGINFTANNEFSNLPVGDGTYYMQDQNGCVFENPFTILMIDIPPIDLFPETACTGLGSVDIQVDPQLHDTYSFSLDNINWTTDQEFDGLTEGQHSIFVEVDSHCVYEVMFVIEPFIAPIFEAEAVASCETSNTGELIVNASQGGPFEYSLDGSVYQTENFWTGLPEGMYTIYIKDAEGCVYQKTAMIDIVVDPVVTWVTEDACDGIANGAVTMYSGGEELLYSLDNVSFSSDSIITDLGVGIHTVFVQGASGCVHPVEVEVLEAVPLDVVFDDPVIDCSVNEVSLSGNIIESSGDMTYLWNTGSSGSDLNVTESGIYSLSVSDKCSTIDYTWDIQFEEVRQEQPIFFPNIFSANNDGVNDCFLPALDEEVLVLNYHLQIFDRWGNKLFDTTDLDDCWDGRYKNKDVVPGVYVYLLTFDYTYCVDAVSIKRYGDVTVIQ